MLNTILKTGDILMHLFVPIYSENGRDFLGNAKYYSENGRDLHIHLCAAKLRLSEVSWMHLDLIVNTRTIKCISRCVVAVVPESKPLYRPTTKYDCLLLTCLLTEWNQRFDHYNVLRLFLVTTYLRVQCLWLCQLQVLQHIQHIQIQQSANPAFLQKGNRFHHLWSG